MDVAFLCEHVGRITTRNVYTSQWPCSIHKCGQPPRKSPDFSLGMETGLNGWSLVDRTRKSYRPHGHLGQLPDPKQRPCLQYEKQPNLFNLNRIQGLRGPGATDPSLCGRFLSTIKESLKRNAEPDSLSSQPLWTSEIFQEIHWASEANNLCT